MTRRKYLVSPIVINDLAYSTVVIDPHYEVKHSEHINDDLILRLVFCLDRIDQLAEVEKENYSYYVRMIYFDSKCYRLIWLLNHVEGYIGIINVFRDRRGM